MDLAAATVAIVFGGLMGWGLSHRVDDQRPILATLVVGAVIGVLMWALSLGANPSLEGGSLLLGCISGLAAASMRRSQAT
jgi:hypothetical protein